MLFDHDMERVTQQCKKHQKTDKKKKIKSSSYDSSPTKTARPVPVDVDTMGSKSVLKVFAGLVQNIFLFVLLVYVGNVFHSRLL